MSTRTERDLALEAEPLATVGPPAGFVRGTFRSFVDVWKYRELLGLLVRREIKVRYKDSILGLLWTLIRPLALLAVYYLALGKFLGAERAIPDFAIYIFTGLTGYQLFSDIVSGGTASIVTNGGLVKKVYLPRDVFPLSAAGAAAFNFVIQLAVLVTATALLGRAPGGTRLLYLPLSVSVLAVYALAFAFVLAAVNVYLRDVQYLVEIVLMVLFWATPTVYSWELARDAIGSELLANLYLANPVATAIFGMQRAMWVAGDGAAVPDALGVRLVVMLVLGVLLLWLGQRVFSRLEGNFAQEL